MLVHLTYDHTRMGPLEYMMECDVSSHLEAQDMSKPEWWFVHNTQMKDIRLRRGNEIDPWCAAT